MGQIQSALTGIVAAGVGAKVASEIKQEKIAKLQKEQKENYIEAVASLPATQEELAGLKEESKGLRKEIGEIKEIAEASPDEAAKEIKMRQRALKTLKGKVKARKLQIEGYKQIISEYEGR